MKDLIQKEPTVFFVHIIVAMLFVISAISAQSKLARDELQPITAEDFIRPIWHQEDVIINAGDLGRYRFSASADYQLPQGVRIRLELIKLLNDLQEEFNTPVIVMSGYRSQQQDAFLWAKWLDDNVNYVKMLNEKGFKSWEEWVSASQRLPGAPSITSKNQTGDAVDFYWRGLSLQTERKKDIMVELINEIGGKHKYTDEERSKYNIAPGDNNLFKVIGYMPGERASIYNPWGRSYFHVEYQPSDMPPKPSIDMIGTRLSAKEDMEFAYKNGEVVLIQEKDFMYLAKVTEDSEINDIEVRVHIFCDEIREKIGDKVPKSRILTRRREPEGGWGTREVMVEYFSDGEWKFATDVIEFEDYYLVPNQDGSKLKVECKDIRIPIPKVHGGK